MPTPPLTQPAQHHTPPQPAPEPRANPLRPGEKRRIRRLQDTERRPMPTRGKDRDRFAEQVEMARRTDAEVPF